MAKWTTAEKGIVSEKIAENALYKEIFKALLEAGYKRTPEAIRGFIKRNPKKSSTVQKSQIVIEKKYETAIKDIEALKAKILDINTANFEQIGRPKTRATTKILTISDLHIPFENTEVIEHAIRKHSDADILVVNGDIFEHYAVSSWPKQKNVVLKWEYQIAIEWMRLFSDTFKEVYLVSGNHEHRLKSYFAANIAPSISFMVDNDMLSRLAKGDDFNEDGQLTPTHSFPNVHYEPGLLSWYIKIGKCIFAHPRSFSGIPMRTAITTADGFLGREEFQALVIGHTHKIGQLIWRDKLIIEQGCCCVPMDYESDGKAKYLPQAFGYAVIYMDADGNVDFDKTKPVYRGTGFAVKDGYKVKE
jgi:predicted phosphodiesterase/signal recognition particle subunit SEC65